MVGDVARERHLVGDHDHRRALEGELLHDVQHLAHQFGIERRRHLVEQHQLGLHRHGAGDGDTLLLAARQLARKARREVGEADLGQQVTGDGFGLRFAHLLHDHRARHDVAERGHVGEEVELLEHHADAGTEAREIAAPGHRMAGSEVDGAVADPQRAGRGRLEQVDAAQEGRLATARGADHHHHLAAMDVERYAAHGLDRAVALAQSLDAHHHVAAGRSAIGQPWPPCGSPRG